MKLISDHHPIFAKVEKGYKRAVAEVEREAERNLGSSQPNAVYTRWMPSGRARVQTSLPYGLIRQWGGRIRPKNPSGYLVFQTRRGNWVRTKLSVQRGNAWLSRAGERFGFHTTSELRRLG